MFDLGQIARNVKNVGLGIGLAIVVLALGFAFLVLGSQIFNGIAS